MGMGVDIDLLGLAWLLFGTGTRYPHRLSQATPDTHHERARGRARLVLNSVRVGCWYAAVLLNADGVRGARSRSLPRPLRYHLAVKAPDVKTNPRLRGLSTLPRARVWDSRRAQVTMG